MQDLKFDITLYSRPLSVVRLNEADIAPVGPEDAIQDFLYSYFEKSGHKTTIATNDLPFKLDANGVILFIGSVNWYPKIFRQLMALPKPKRPTVVIWHTEPLPPSKVSALPRPRLNFREIAKILLRDNRATDPYSNFFRLRHLYKKKLINIVFSAAQNHQEFLQEKSIPSHCVPIGCSPSFGHDINVSRDIDTLFIGLISIPRRKKLIKFLQRNGINMMTLGSWSDPKCWGDNRMKILNRSKILLNLQRFPGELAGFRLNLGMANKTLVISEPIYNSDPYIPGKHYVSASGEEMPEIIKYYLSNPKEREKIAQEGHRFVTEELTMDKSSARIVELIQLHQSRQT